MTLQIKTFLSEPYIRESTTHHKIEGLSALLENHQIEGFSALLENHHIEGLCPLLIIILDKVIIVQVVYERVILKTKLQQREESKRVVLSQTEKR